MMNLEIGLRLQMNENIREPRVLPVRKKIGDQGYSGSIAKKGEMSAVVIGTGNNTFFGRTANLVASAGGGASHSGKATAQIGDFLIITSVILKERHPAQADTV